MKIDKITIEQRDRFIHAAAVMVAERTAVKSIRLSMSDMGDGLAKDWASLGQSLPGFFGYPTVKKCEEEIRRVFGIA